MKLVIAWLLAVPALALAQAAQPAAPAAEPAKTAPAAEPKAGAAAVADAKLGTGVADREPEGVAESFKPDVGKVYCWTKVTGAEGTEITHAWFKGDEKMGEVKLAVKYPSTRTWSAKTIPADGTGDWRVDVIAADGTVLKSLSFKVE
jgi:Protein of unknown function (DUF2914)